MRLVDGLWCKYVSEILDVHSTTQSKNAKVYCDTSSVWLGSADGLVGQYKMIPYHKYIKKTFNKVEGLSGIMHHFPSGMQ